MRDAVFVYAYLYIWTRWKRTNKAKLHTVLDKPSSLGGIDTNNMSKVSTKKVLNKPDVLGLVVATLELVFPPTSDLKSVRPWFWTKFPSRFGVFSRGCWICGCFFCSSSKLENWRKLWSRFCSKGRAVVDGIAATRLSLENLSLGVALFSDEGRRSLPGISLVVVRKGALTWLTLSLVGALFLDRCGH